MVSGLLDKLQGKEEISIMADRGFTIKDQLDKLNISLNIPPFLKGRKQSTAEEVKEGHQIASLHIHVEHTIGCVKNFSILRGTLPISMTRLANQIVSVCAFLSNMQPALIPQPNTDTDDDNTTRSV